MTQTNQNVFEDLGFSAEESEEALMLAYEVSGESLPELKTIAVQLNADQNIRMKKQESVRADY